MATMCTVGVTTWPIHISATISRQARRMTDYECAPCLLGGTRQQAITIYGGAAVCGGHLVAAATTGETLIVRRRRALELQQKVDAALNGQKVNAGPSDGVAEFTHVTPRTVSVFGHRGLPGAEAVAQVARDGLASREGVRAQPRRAGTSRRSPSARSAV